MFKIKNKKCLLELGFKEYHLGYSKRYLNGDYSFIDVLSNDLILKKAKFVEKDFEYENVTYEDVYFMIKRSLNLNDSESIKKYIEENFRKED